MEYLWDYIRGNVRPLKKKFPNGGDLVDQIVGKSYDAKLWVLLGILVLPAAKNSKIQALYCVVSEL